MTYNVFGGTFNLSSATPTHVPILVEFGWVGNYMKG